MPSTTATTRRTRTTKPAASKAITVKMKGDNETKSTWKFVFSGTTKDPIVKSVYVNKEALDALAEGPLTVVFSPYVPGANQRPMPVSAIRYSGDAGSIRDLYVDRVQAEKKGFTEESTVSVEVKVVSEDTISLAITVS